ncbi:hypothetical protein TRFO_08486 [Tritrichomonas foetus]|uniref:SPRY domain-containing protein n=1 Tax=Tritrichomonas foetus TaxID=1144522 RepID=A0A1J4JLF0_9EUKA|nr:hypothetical protein TRFO_08486 [Tritrichomonas foetus]|eukprot:OHS99239.1 hypothetical protein TRFO_08486 [Tritrichomonas foetus]
MLEIIKESTGEYVPDEDGIFTSYGDFYISLDPQKNSDNFGKQSAFSFLFLKIHHNSDIEFGLIDENGEKLAFNYFQYISMVRSSHINPQISIDAIGVLINLYLKDGNLHIYINNVLFEQTYPFYSEKSLFYLKITNKVRGECIFATSIRNKTENDRFFPCYEPEFWTLDNYKKCISDFTICLNDSSSTQFNPVISNKPLMKLPGYPNLRYFEVQIRNYSNRYRNDWFSLGLTTKILIDTSNYTSPTSNYTNKVNLIKKSNAFGYIFAGDEIFYKNNHFPINIKNKIIGSLRVNTLGFGIENNRLFFTLNGTREDIDWVCNPEKEYFPFISMTCIGIELTLNFGQMPFEYEKIKPFEGWTTWFPYHEHKFRLGMSPHRHLLNAFLSFGRNQNIPNPLLYKYELPPEGMYEAHFLRLDSPELIGMGLGPFDFRVGDMIGWDTSCIGLHSDDGYLFYQTGSGTMNVVPDYFIKTGTTETCAIKDSNVTYYIDRMKKADIGRNFTYERYPVITARGSVQFVLNFGESPFYAIQKDDEDEDAVQLFNKLKVKMTNSKLDEYGLKIDDVIESHDRTFRGTVAGELNGMVYVYIHNFQGAFPLVENNKYEIMLNYRIVYRKNSLWQKVLINTKYPEIVDISKSSMNCLYATPFGLSFILGETEKGNYVLRPVLDLMNNTPSLLLNVLPENIMNGVFGKIKPLNDNEEDHGIQMFDIVTENNKDYAMVLGKPDDSDNQFICWNGAKIIVINPPKKVILNPLGYGSIKSQIGMIITSSYIGMQKGGRYYPFDYTGSNGSQLEIKYKEILQFPFNNGCEAPPILFSLLKLLNDYCIYNKDSETKLIESNNNSVEINESDLFYSTSTIDENSPCPSVDLVTSIEYNGVVISATKSRKPL